jgi:hypothetical protein
LTAFFASLPFDIIMISINDKVRDNCFTEGIILNMRIKTFVRRKIIIIPRIIKPC